MTPEERSAFVVQRREEGDAAYCKQDWSAAISAYRAGLECVTLGRNGGSRGRSQADGWACSGHRGGDVAGATRFSDAGEEPVIASLLDRSLALLEAGHYTATMADCDSILALEPRNVVALLRRAQAWMGLGEPFAATDDALRLLDLAPAATAEQASQ